MHIHRFGTFSSIALTLAFAAAGCGANDAPTEPTEHAGSTAQADTVTSGIISSSSCTTRLNRLVQCVVPPAKWTRTPFETAVPLRTEVTAQRTGNCSTAYPLEVTFQAASGDPVKVPYLSASTTMVRRRDGLAMDTVTMTDSSPWTKNASFDPTCNIKLALNFNVVDVDSAAQAAAIITSLEQDLANKISVREHANELVLFQKAYDFMSAVAKNFHTQLTNESMQALRSAADDSMDVLLDLITSCDGSLAPADRKNLGRLMRFFPALGHPGDWKNPDGTLMTIADFVGAEQAAVLATVDAISAAHPSGPAAGYQLELDLAAKAVVEAQAKLDLAHTQLAAWIPIPVKKVAGTGMGTGFRHPVTVGH
jgi:hypothetical protein